MLLIPQQPDLVIELSFVLVVRVIILDVHMLFLNVHIHALESGVSGIWCLESGVSGVWRCWSLWSHWRLEMAGQNHQPEIQVSE